MLEARLRHDSPLEKQNCFYLVGKRSNANQLVIRSVTAQDIKTAVPLVVNKAGWSPHQPANGALASLGPAGMGDSSMPMTNQSPFNAGSMLIRDAVKQDDLHDTHQP